MKMLLKTALITLVFSFTVALTASAEADPLLSEDEYEKILMSIPESDRTGTVAYSDVTSGKIYDIKYEVIGSTSEGIEISYSHPELGGGTTTYGGDGTIQTRSKKKIIVAVISAAITLAGIVADVLNDKECTSTTSTTSGSDGSTTTTTTTTCK